MDPVLLPSPPPETRLPPDRVRLPLDFDTARLRKDLETFSEDEWIDHFNSRDYEGVWRILPLRGPAGAEHPILQASSHSGTRDWADTPFADRAPACRAVMQAFRCPLTSVRLLSLAPGARILEHSDPDLGFEDGFARIHVPVQTHPDVEFYLNGERVVMEEGQCWYLRLSDPHHVTNGGPVSRIHLILDCVIDDWLKYLLLDGNDTPE